MANPKKSPNKSTVASSLSSADISRIIEMAWEDRTPFEAIEHQYGLPEKETKALMKQQMTPSSYRMWRDRVNTRATKHLKKRPFEVGRFKSKNQK